MKCLEYCCKSGFKPDNYTDLLSILESVKYGEGEALLPDSPSSEWKKYEFINLDKFTGNYNSLVSNIDKYFFYKSIDCSVCTEEDVRGVVDGYIEINGIGYIDPKLKLKPDAGFIDRIRPKWYDLLTAEKVRGFLLLKNFYNPNQKCQSFNFFADMAKHHGAHNAPRLSNNVLIIMNQELPEDYDVERHFDYFGENAEMLCKRYNNSLQITYFDGKEIEWIGDD